MLEFWQKKTQEKKLVATSLEFQWFIDMNYNKKTPYNQAFLQKSCVFKGKTNTWLHISFDEDISDELGNSLPYPHKHYQKGNKLVYCWLLDGYFDTIAGYEYLNDIIARFKITFINSQYLKHSKENTLNINPIKLKAFQGLKNRASDIVNSRYKRAETHQDYVWWCIKLQCEELIKKEGLIIYETLENWAFKHFIDKAKDRSTLRAKCRGTYNWYFERDWKIGRANKKYENMRDYQEKNMATRTEQALAMGRQKEEKNKEKIENALSGLLADSMFRKKNGTWNAKAIADYLSLDPRTVRKYLKELS